MSFASARGGAAEAHRGGVPLAGGIAERPGERALAGVAGARVAAAHGDDDVGRLHSLGRQDLRLLDHIAAAPDGTACACHLPDALGISQPTLSHHMKKLVDAGLVDREQRGRWAHYTVRGDVLASVRAFLRSLGE